MLFRLVRDVDRYPDLPGSRGVGRWADSITVDGTLEQAQFIAFCLSNFEAGCNNYWIVEGYEDANFPSEWLKAHG